MNAIATTSEDSITRWMRICVITGGLLTIVAGFGVLAYQSVAWLQHGTWMPLEMNIAWDWVTRKNPSLRPDFPWLGAQKIAVWFLEGPMSGGFVIFGLLTILVGRTNLAAYVLTVAVLWYVVVHLTA